MTGHNWKTRKEKEAKCNKQDMQWLSHFWKCFVLELELFFISTI